LSSTSKRIKKVTTAKVSTKNKPHTITLSPNLQSQHVSFYDSDSEYESRISSTSSKFNVCRNIFSHTSSAQKSTIFLIINQTYTLPNHPDLIPDNLDYNQYDQAFIKGLNQANYKHQLPHNSDKENYNTNDLDEAYGDGENNNYNIAINRNS